MPPYDDPDVLLDKFLNAAYGQLGDKYRFGVHASADDTDPKAFDSSELVEWAAHRAGLHDMPDGSWNQYRFLERQGGAVEVDEALRTPGALVFGFSSDPTASPNRPAKAYVGISVGDGEHVIDVSERAGEVKVLPAGDFYKYGAKIPGLHEMLPDSIEIDTDGDGSKDSSLRRPFPHGEIDTNGDGIPDSSVAVPDPPVLGPEDRDDVVVPDRATNVPGSRRPAYEPDDDPVTPSPPDPSYSPGRRIIHQNLPDDPEPHSSYLGEPRPDDQVGSLDDDVAGFTSPAEAALTSAAGTTAYADAPDLAAHAGDDGYGASTYSDSYSYADSYTDLPADV